jgi:hypothetical protein
VERKPQKLNQATHISLHNSRVINVSALLCMLDSAYISAILDLKLFLANYENVVRFPEALLRLILNRVSFRRNL